jgi:Fur family peroxide stress response transcriptional regulator
MNNYTLMLKEHNLKVTPQRLGILSLLGSMGHVSIEDLYSCIRIDFNSISIATLYKNINHMVEVNLIKEVKIPNNKSKYEILKEKHSHMICKKCYKLEDLKLSLDSLIGDASKMSGYLFDDNALVLSGTCPQCQQSY